MDNHSYNGQAEEARRLWTIQEESGESDVSVPTSREHTEEESRSSESPTSDHTESEDVGVSGEVSDQETNNNTGSNPSPETDNVAGSSSSNFEDPMHTTSAQDSDSQEDKTETEEARKLSTTEEENFVTENLVPAQISSNNNESPPSESVSLENARLLDVRLNEEPGDQNENYSTAARPSTVVESPTHTTTYNPTSQVNTSEIQAARNLSIIGKEIDVAEEVPAQVFINNDELRSSDVGNYTVGISGQTGNQETHDNAGYHPDLQIPNYSESWLNRSTSGLHSPTTDRKDNRNTDSVKIQEHANKLPSSENKMDARANYVAVQIHDSEHGRGLQSAKQVSCDKQDVGSTRKQEESRTQSVIEEEREIEKDVFPVSETSDEREKKSSKTASYVRLNEETQDPESDDAIVHHPDDEEQQQQQEEQQENVNNHMRDLIFERFPQIFNCYRPPCCAFTLRSYIVGCVIYTVASLFASSVCIFVPRIGSDKMIHIMQCLVVIVPLGVILFFLLIVLVILACRRRNSYNITEV